MTKRIMPSIMWTRGKKIANDGNVQIDYVNNQNQTVEATVFGTSAYGVTVGRDADDDFCECPFFPDHGYCKHIAAVVRLLKSQSRPIEKLFQEVDLFDNFSEKFPNNYLQLSREFEKQLEEHPLVGKSLYHNKEDYNRVRSDPDTWQEYLTNETNIKLQDTTTNITFTAPKNTRYSHQAKSNGAQFLEQLNLPEIAYFQPLDGDTTSPLELEVTLSVNKYGELWGDQENRFFIKLRIADQRDHKFYMVAHIDEFLKAYANHEVYHTAGKRQFSLSPTRFSAAEQQVLATLLTCQEINPQKFNGSENERRKHVLLNPGDTARLQDVFVQLTTFEFEPFYDEQSYSALDFTPFTKDNGVFSAVVTSDPTGFELTLTQDYDTVVPADQILIAGNEFYQANTTQFAVISNLILSNSLQAGLGHDYDAAAENTVLRFETDELEALRRFLNYFGQIGTIQAPAEIAVTPMTPHFDLEKEDQTVVLTLSYDYGGQLVASYNADQLPNEQRNIEKEQQARQYLESLGFTLAGQSWVQDFSDPVNLYQFFTAELPNLRLNGRVTISPDLQALLQEGATLAPTIAVSESAGLLSVNFSFNGIDDDDVDQILDQLDQNRPFVARPDGSLVLLDDHLQQVSQALRNIRVQGKVSHGHMQLHAAQAFAVQAALGDTADFDAQFQQLTHDLAHPETFDIRHERPVQATLRPYQKVGVQWLEMLNSYGFGGILADEMGLGKTLQTITFLNNHLDDQHVSVVVSPASLIYNWREEFQKFAPDIRAVVVDGTKDERRDFIQNSDAQVLITSYNSIRRDITEYEQQAISYLILDEAQFVKNGSTKTNQSLRKLAPQNTFALSGTPIENRAEELWSIFALVMPGLLPSKKDFKKLTPAQIAIRVKPFILRREKQTVLKDLPPKVETNLTNEMTKDQKTVYLAQLKQMQVKVRGLSNDGFVKNKIEILAGLTRLRQICDTPALYMDDYTGDSGKLDQLDEILRQAVDSDRHVLIFSQFTSMLDIIERQLKQHQLPAYVLKGDTKPKDRLAMVDAFNAGEKSIFLISLKAGGTGLNLTGADLVVLVDLWWNPAVEDQATARAHRIGQQKQVDVYRLITKGTIEEQIYKLQEKKRDFVDQVLSGTENKGSLTDDEIRLILGIES